LRWLGSRPIGLFFGVLLGCIVLDVAYPVATGIMVGHSYVGRQLEMIGAIRDSSTALVVVAALAIAASAAVSLTGEREQDTWVSLATTLLTPGEIIGAKQFGAVWSARWFGAALLVLWGVGTLFGTIHPLGVLAALGTALIGAWFIASVGVFVSGRARNSTRALMLTLLCLFIVLVDWPWSPLGSLITDMRSAVNGTSGGWQVAQAAWTSLDYVHLFSRTGATYAIFAGILTCWSIRKLRGTWGQA
jgi:hypothetical protein